MEKRRFKLNPELSASENLGLAVRCAVPVVLSRYRLGNLDLDTLNELYSDIRVAAYRHFIENKVIAHGYCRETKDGKPLTFFDNVISSVWSVAGNILDRLMKDIREKYRNIYVGKDNYEFEEGKIWDTIADTGIVLETTQRTRKVIPTKRLKSQRERPWIFLGSLLEDYIDYCEDCKLQGVEAITEDAWVSRNASPEMKLTYERKKSPKMASDYRRHWMQEYKRLRREKEKRR